jgi:hypothetical protein
VGQNLRAGLEAISEELTHTHDKQSRSTNKRALRSSRWAVLPLKAVALTALSTDTQALAFAPLALAIPTGAARWVLT